VGERFDDEDESPESIAEWFRAEAEFHDRMGEHDQAEELRRAGNWPRSVIGSPLVLDTDIGGDPDDAVAVAVAALTCPELALVVTGDEHRGQRARFARALLDLCGRPEVQVVAGADLGNTRYFVVEDLIPSAVPEQSADLSAVARLCRSAVAGPSDRPGAGVVRWVGMGPMSNLAAVLGEDPSLAATLDVTQMGGALEYRNPDRAEHNVRLDVPAARAVLAAARSVRFVISDVTYTSEIEITAGDEVYRWLASDGSPGWARLLLAHLDVWFARMYPGTMQHDALTLSAALRYPFVDFRSATVEYDDLGRMIVADGGTRCRLARAVRYQAFNTWLRSALQTSTQPAAQLAVGVVSGPVNPALPGRVTSGEVEPGGRHRRG
jgi:inosine-uridine nucleoside N-ribohydrolase